MSSGMILWWCLAVDLLDQEWLQVQNKSSQRFVLSIRNQKIKIFIQKIQKIFGKRKIVFYFKLQVFCFKIGNIYFADTGNLIERIEGYWVLRCFFPSFNLRNISPILKLTFILEACKKELIYITSHQDLSLCRKLRYIFATQIRKPQMI